MAIIFKDGEQIAANKENIKALSGNTAVHLAFTVREVFEKKGKENKRLLKLCIDAMENRKIRFFKLPFCVADLETTSRFNGLALSVGRGFYFEGAYIFPLSLWDGKLPKLELFQKCRRCEFLNKFCLGCYGFTDSKALNKLLELALSKIKPGDNTLDIGCGNGFYIEKLTKKVGANSLYLLDPKETELLELKKRFGYKKKPKIICGVAEELPFSNDSFEVLLAINSFSHFKDPKKAVLEAKRVLKKSGLFLLLERINTKKESSCKEGFDSHNGLKKEQIKKIFLENGFKLELQELAKPYYLLIFKK